MDPRYLQQWQGLTQQPDTPQAAAQALQQMQQGLTQQPDTRQAAAQAYGARARGRRGRAWWKNGLDRPGAGPAVANRQAPPRPGGVLGTTYNPATNQLLPNRAATPARQGPPGQAPAAPGVSSRISPGTVPMKKGLR